MSPASSSDELSQGRSGHPVADSVPIISIKFWWKNLSSGKKEKKKFPSAIVSLPKIIPATKRMGKRKERKETG